MESAGRGDGSDFYGLRLKPELLTVLRHAGIDDSLGVNRSVVMKIP